MSKNIALTDECRMVVAWTALQFPWKYRSLSDELKAKFTSSDLPPFAEGMDHEGMVNFFTTLELAKDYEYDIENDYRECLRFLPSGGGYL
jgi:hypothetical protein